jgi:molybdate-binding protein/DNA-binding transcriptional regulator YhcF (GntR family)
MEEPHLYKQIVEAVRQEILSGKVKAGDRLPPVREMSLRWSCTAGTVQRAYQELSRQGLVHTRAGQGTTVSGELIPEYETPLRRAQLLHQAEAFLLEGLSAGFSPSEIEQAMRLALDRWRAQPAENPPPDPGCLRFNGSHDPAVALIAAQAAEIFPGLTFEISYTGSLGGLMALAQGKADLGGCHLWDAESDTYNIPFVHKLLPGRQAWLVTLAHRRVGLITPPGNPAQLSGLADLLRPGLRFVNRNPGSGTRVWLDAQLKRIGLAGSQVNGYEREKATHYEVAQAVAEGAADTGLGIEAAALSFGLGFTLLTTEAYQLVIPAEKWPLPAIQALVKWLQSPTAQTAINSLGGYDTTATGTITHLS